MEEKYEKVAKQIAKCEYMLIGAGAGMSADSGLMVYGEVSKTTYFEENQLTYRDLSEPRLMVTKPDVFYAWTATCIEKYRNTEPHEGYKILNRWKEKLMEKKKKEIEELQKIMEENKIREMEEGFAKAKNVFVITTNVDGFFKRAGFEEGDVCETHGSYLRFQCGGIRRGEGPPFKLFDGPCVAATWQLPDDFHFLFDESSI